MSVLLFLLEGAELLAQISKFGRRSQSLQLFTLWQCVVELRQCFQASVYTCFGLISTFEFLLPLGEEQHATDELLRGLVFLQEQSDCLLSNLLPTAILQNAKHPLSPPEVGKMVSILVGFEFADSLQLENDLLRGSFLPVAEADLVEHRQSVCSVLAGETLGQFTHPQGKFSCLQLTPLVAS